MGIGAYDCDKVAARRAPPLAWWQVSSKQPYRKEKWGDEEEYGTPLIMAHLDRIAG